MLIRNENLLVTQAQSLLEMLMTHQMNTRYFGEQNVASWPQIESNWSAYRQSFFLLKTHGKLIGSSYIPRLQPASFKDLIQGRSNQALLTIETSPFLYTPSTQQDTTPKFLLGNILLHPDCPLYKVSLLYLLYGSLAQWLSVQKDLANRFDFCGIGMTPAGARLFRAFGFQEVARTNANPAHTVFVRTFTIEDMTLCISNLHEQLQSEVRKVSRRKR